MTVPALSQDYTLSGTPAKTERAWAAGFFDGEGWTGATKGRNPCLRLSMAQAKDYASLERFMQIVGGGHLYGPYPPKRPGWSEQMFFNAHNDEALRAIFLMWPYLGEVKKQQARTAIAEWKEAKCVNADAAKIRREERMKATLEKTHCRRGHVLTEDNIYFHKRDQRPYCRTCQRESSRQSYYRRKEANA